MLTKDSEGREGLLVRPGDEDTLGDGLCGLEEERSQVLVTRGGRPCCGHSTCKGPEAGKTPCTPKGLGHGLLCLCQVCSPYPSLAQTWHTYFSVPQLEDGRPPERKALTHSMCLSRGKYPCCTLLFSPPPSSCPIVDVMLGAAAIIL